MCWIPWPWPDLNIAQQIHILTTLGHTKLVHVRDALRTHNLHMIALIVIWNTRIKNMITTNGTTMKVKLSWKEYFEFIKKYSFDILKQLFLLVLISLWRWDQMLRMYQCSSSSTNDDIFIAVGHHFSRSTSTKRKNSAAKSEQGQTSHETRLINILFSSVHWPDWWLTC